MKINGVTIDQNLRIWLRGLVSIHVTQESRGQVIFERFIKNLNVCCSAASPAYFLEVASSATPTTALVTGRTLIAGVTATATVRTRSSGGITAERRA